MSTKYKITSNTLSVREARAKFSTVLDRAHDFGESFVITSNGKPVAMVKPYDDTAIKDLPRNKKEDKKLLLII